jgi:hypothetical protein
MAALNAADYSRSEHKATCRAATRTFKVTVPVPNPTDVAQQVSHTTKAADELYRLMAFADGRPDSRPDLGGGVNRDLMALLTPEQFSTLEAWISAAQARG